MSIFNLHADVLGDYRDFVRSFFTVADDRAREFIERDLVAEQRALAGGVAPSQPLLCARRVGG